MCSEVTSYQIGANGALTKIASMTTIRSDQPKGYGSKAAELAITPDGRHLYASNRAFWTNMTSTVAVFDISSDGTLKLTQNIDCPSFPRGMSLMPDGKFLLTASQTNSEVTSFKVGERTGHLTLTNSKETGPWGA